MKAIEPSLFIGIISLIKIAARHFKKIISISAGFALLASMALVVPAFAQTKREPSGRCQCRFDRCQGYARTGGPGGTSRGMRAMKPGVFGTVTAVNGDSITISGRQTPPSMPSTPPATPPAAVTYTAVDATSATVKNNRAPPARSRASPSATRSSPKARSAAQM